MWRERVAYAYAYGRLDSYKPGDPFVASPDFADAAVNLGVPVDKLRALYDRMAAPAASPASCPDPKAA